MTLFMTGKFAFCNVKCSSSVKSSLKKGIIKKKRTLAYDASFNRPHNEGRADLTSCRDVDDHSLKQFKIRIIACIKFYCQSLAKCLVTLSASVP